MNKQPFYHSVGILFTATTEISAGEFSKLVSSAIKKHDKILPDSVEIEYVEAEPGNPSDLM